MFKNSDRIIYNLCMERNIAVIDLKSFFASVECVERGLDPLKALLVVCDTSRGESTLVLSASAALKSRYGVSNISRKRSLPKVDGLIYATPRMKLYVKKSAQVVNIFLDFVGEDDIHVYSIDEAFLNLEPYLKLYRCTAMELVQKILLKIKADLGLIATAGIGPNMFLAKSALDNDAKNKKDFIAEWAEKDVKEKLWRLRPLSKMWGISTGLEKRLNALGIQSVGELAIYPKEILRQKLGQIGEDLWEHANGIDNSDIRKKYIPKNTSLSNFQVLMRDYLIDETRLIIKEMADTLSWRMRLEEKMTSNVGLSISYSNDNLKGFSQRISLNYPTSDNDEIYKALVLIFDKYVENYPIRRIGIVFGKLVSARYEQVDIFIGDKEQEKRHSLRETLDKIQLLYGKNTVLRTSSLSKESTIKTRNNQIGGHRK
jgi:DNA polymerase V